MNALRIIKSDEAPIALNSVSFTSPIGHNQQETFSMLPLTCRTIPVTTELTSTHTFILLPPVPFYIISFSYSGHCLHYRVMECVVFCLENACSSNKKKNHGMWGNRVIFTGKSIYKRLLTFWSQTVGISRLMADRLAHCRKGRWYPTEWNISNFVNLSLGHCACLTLDKCGCHS